MINAKNKMEKNDWKVQPDTTVQVVDPPGFKSVCIFVKSFSSNNLGSNINSFTIRKRNGG